MARGARTNGATRRRASRRLRPSYIVGLLVLALPACGGPAEERSPVSLARYEEALTGSDAVTRAQLWVDAMVPYCQSPNGQPDPDQACSSTCMRPMNAAWDPYRSDCSGFVSWAWDLPPPGRTTSELAPAVTDITDVINGDALEPGDALNIPGDHMILFVSWVQPGVTATFMEEPGCSSSITYAHEFTSDVEISGPTVTVDYDGAPFTAIRYRSLTGQGDGGTVTVPDAGTPSCYVTTLGESGECLLTSDCASMGGTSTPNYCPGPADIQCCTGLAPAGCTANRDCSGATPICDSSTRMCRGCSSDGDCGQGVCAMSTTHPMGGRCVECTSNAACPSSYQCDPASDTCVQCVSNTDCPAATPTCNSMHMCVCEGNCADAGAPADAGPVFVFDGGRVEGERAPRGGCATTTPDLAPIALALVMGFGTRRRRVRAMT